MDAGPSESYSADQGSSEQSRKVLFVCEVLIGPRRIGWRPHEDLGLIKQSIGDCISHSCTEVMQDNFGLTACGGIFHSWEAAGGGAAQRWYRVAGTCRLYTAGLGNS